MVEGKAAILSEEPLSWPESIERLREREFPLTASWSYLNHAGTGPLPASHVRAAQRFLEEMSTEKPPTTLTDSARKTDEVRRLAATLLRCRPEDLAILCNTTQALSLVPLGLDWAEGDEVLLYEREFPNVVFPWLQLQSKGVRVKFVPDRGNRFDLDELVDLVTDRTRVISLSLVNFATGFRAPVEEIGRLCKRRGIWLLVDAIQAVGVIPVSAPDLGADIVAASGYKHLLSGYAVALCYCSERAREELTIPVPGWSGTLNHTDAGDMLNYSEVVFTPDARRFEPTVPNFAGLWGAAESLRILVEADPVRIERYVRALLDDLLTEVESRGYAVKSSMVPAERSSLLSVTPPGSVDFTELSRRFLDKRVAVSIREGSIRIAPHLYNVGADIERALAVMP